MMSLLYTLAISFIAFSYAGDMCFWGRSAVYERAANGLYREGPENVNGKPYWKLDRSGQDCGHEYYYIYWYNENAQWYVGFSDTSTFSFAPSAGYIAKCDDLSSFGSPANCDGGWTFSYSDPSDVNVIVTEDRCPSLDCAQIDIDDGTSAGNPGCGVFSGNLFNQTGANEYSTVKLGSLYKSLWFNEAVWKWYCTDTDAVESRCGSWTYTDDGLSQTSLYNESWTDISAGESFQWTLDNVCSSTNCGTSGTKVTVTCYGMNLYDLKDNVHCIHYLQFSKFRFLWILSLSPFPIGIYKMKSDSFLNL